MQPCVETEDGEALGLLQALKGVADLNLSNVIFEWIVKL